MEISPELKTVADRLRAICSRREYCSSEIRTKALKALDGDAGSAEQVLQLLVKEKFVDDLRYSCAYARDKAAISGWGTIKIRYHLSMKGVARDVIEEALREIDSSKADARLEKLIRLKYASYKNDPQARNKVVRYALGRGYTYDEASAVIDIIRKEYDI